MALYRMVRQVNKLFCTFQRSRLVVLSRRANRSHLRRSIEGIHRLIKRSWEWDDRSSSQYHHSMIWTSCSLCGWCVRIVSSVKFLVWGQCNLRPDTYLNPLADFSNIQSMTPLCRCIVNPFHYVKWLTCSNFIGPSEVYVYPMPRRVPRSHCIHGGHNLGSCM